MLEGNALVYSSSEDDVEILHLVDLTSGKNSFSVKLSEFHIESVTSLISNDMWVDVVQK